LLRSVADGSVRTRREEVAGGEEGLTEVAGDDVLGSANRGEVDAGIPAQEEIDVRRYLIELKSGQGAAEKRVEEFGDARGVHDAVHCRG
jgi:hypothetical protein